MTASRGMYIRSTADIPQNLEDIRNADMNELGETTKNKRIRQGGGDAKCLNHIHQIPNWNY